MKETKPATAVLTMPFTSIQFSDENLFLSSQWEELYSRKPDDDYEDPGDVAAIKEAQENMGDYKLKTAADYVVPDHLRMNVDKARGRLLSIKDMVSCLCY